MKFRCIEATVLYACLRSCITYARTNTGRLTRNIKLKAKYYFVSTTTPRNFLFGFREISHLCVGDKYSVRALLKR